MRLRGRASIMSRSIAFSWSGGKDSALALHELRFGSRYTDVHPTVLLTTVTLGYNRVSGHGVQRDLIRRQAEALNLDLHEKYIPRRSTMLDYTTVMGRAYQECQAAGIKAIGFGDIFLKGPKRIHLTSMRTAGLRGIFPLWHRNSLSSVHRLIDLGYEARVICVNGQALDASFLGRTVDRGFLRELPPEVDPSGENGEYHTFVVDGPLYERRIRCVLGSTVSRDGHHYREMRCI